MNVSLSDLYVIIGKLTVENELLKQENEVLAATLTKERRDVPSEVPSAATGPDNN